MLSLQQFVSKEAEEECRARAKRASRSSGTGGQRVMEQGVDPAATPKRTEHKKEEGSTATSSKAAASSSTAANAPQGVCKMQTKRELLRRHSNEAAKHKRDLT